MYFSSAGVAVELFLSLIDYTVCEAGYEQMELEDVRNVTLITTRVKQVQHSASSAPRVETLQDWTDKQNAVGGGRGMIHIPHYHSE